MESLLCEIIKSNTGIDYSNELLDRDANFFSSKIAMNPRELVGVTLQLESRMKQKIPDKFFLEGEFSSFNKVLDIINI